METTREEALALLRGWRDDRRIIVATLSLSDKTSSCVVGRIERLDPIAVRIDDQSFSSHENRTGIEIDLDSAMSFSFDDTRLSEGLKESGEIKESYEGFLFISLSAGAVVNLWIAK